MQGQRVGYIRVSTLDFLLSPHLKYAQSLIHLGEEFKEV